MAKNTQQAEVIVTMNGQAAKRAVEEMTQEYQRLQKAANDAYKSGNDALGKKLEAQAQKLTRDIEITRRETKKFADVMKNINGASLKELRSAAKQLQSEINKLTPGTQAFIEKSKQLQQVNTRIRQLTNEFKGLVTEEKAATFSLKGLADGFNKYFGMVTAGIAAITGLSMAFRKSAQDAAALDDTYSDVMKTTGLLHDEVAELDQELMKIDTRTSREQLLLLARDAGKLGIQGKEDILGFVRAADQIQVALGEDLGEGAIKELGKIADVLGLTQSMGIEKSLLSIASAVNAVGQASTASEGYLVDFTQRLAGVAAQTGISASNIIGFASGLDQSAMKVEMASTAFQKFLMKLYEDPAKFAAYANLEVGKFTELLQNDANQAVITILKALKDQDGFASLVPIFKDMGLDGARAVSVLAAMATNIQAVTDAQALANDEFEKATSVTEEYNTKNNNMQAQLEKARKEFQNASIALGQSLNPIMLKSTKLTTHLIKALASYGKEIRNAAIAVAALTAVIKLNTIAQGIDNAARKVGNTLIKTGSVAVNLLKVAYFNLRGQTERAAAAQAALNAAMSASVIGLVATAVVGLTAAITHWVKKSREANVVNDRMEEIQKRINSEYAEGAGKVQALTNIVHNNNLELDQRRRALNELKSIVPGYHADLTEEGHLINNNTNALKEYLKNLEKVTRQKILQDEYEKAVSEVMAAEQAVADAQKAKDEALKKAGGNTATESVTTTTMMFDGQQWQQEIKKQTPYGAAVEKETAAQVDLNKKKEAQLEIEQRINNEFGIRAGQVSDEQKAIRQVNERYKQLFNDAREMNLDNPAAAEEQIQQLKEEQRKEIAEIRKNHAEKRTVETEETAATNAILTQTQFDFLQDRQEKLTKKEKEMVAKGYEALSAEDSKALKARYDKLMKADNNANQKAYSKKKQMLDSALNYEEKQLKMQLLKKEISEEEYDAAIKDKKAKYYKDLLDLAEKYNQDTSSILASQLDDQIKDLEEAAKKAAEAARKAAKEAEDVAKKEMEEWEKKMKELEELEKKAQDVSDSLRPKERINREFENELQNLEDLHTAKLISEQDYLDAVDKLHKEHNKALFDEDLENLQDYVEKANAVIQFAGDFVSQIKEYETAKMEAEYQKQLTAAGDNAEQKEAIDAEYEQKKLDLQKKYADVEMGINIAKAIGASALAVMQAWTAAGGQPILFAIFAALIAATTAIEIATLVKQRNAIKNASVSGGGGGGSSSAPKTGQRTVTGYSEGGETPWSASDNTPVGIVHANEYVIPAWMKRREPRLIADLERYRKAGSHGRTGSKSKGFADGGYTGNATPASNTVADSSAAIERAVYNGIRAAIEGEWLRAYLVRNDLTEIDNQDARFKDIFTL